MKHETMMRCARALAAAVLCAAPLSAQTPAPQGPDAAMDGAREEMKALFRKVETRLREIDRLLSDASAGDREALKKNADSGMGELLEQTRARGQEVLEGIDRILEIARQFGEPRPGSGGGEPQNPGGDKNQLDRRGQQSTEREQTPAQPESGEPSPGPKPEPSEKPDDKSGGQSPPSGNKGSKDEPSNTPGPKPPGGASDAANRNPDGQERWGELPVHVRDVFRIEGGGDMPVQYRDWIDSYYRRLNKKP